MRDLAALEPTLTIGPVVGWRVWEVAPRRPPETGPPTILRGRHGVGWLTATEEARCLDGWGRPVLTVGRRSEASVHVGAPGVRCRCGVYASRVGVGTGTRWVPNGAPLVRGSVELTGSVIEGSLGYRAERATIVGPLAIEITCAGPAGAGEPCRRPAREVARVGLTAYRGTCGRHAHGRSARSSAVPCGDWLARVVPHLETRYGVPVVDLQEEDRRGHR